ncbi:MAG: hypothetical protein ND895_26940 [Pyrinomonadaceae bacterium]|nr:hypothetical protein [Pyrinomonadaceae bacterium]
MSPIGSVLLLVLLFFPFFQGQQAPAGLNSPAAKSTYIGLRYDGNKLPRGHKWIGGALLTDPYSNEKQYGVTEVSKGKVRMMWLDRLTHHDAAGHAHWEIRDVLFLPPMRKNQLLFYVNCFLANKPDSELVVITDAVVRGGYYGRVRYAWRANRQAEKFQQIPTTGIKCEGQGDD